MLNGQQQNGVWLLYSTDSTLYTVCNELFLSICMTTLMPQYGYNTNSVWNHGSIEILKVLVISTCSVGLYRQLFWADLVLFKFKNKKIK